MSDINGILSYGWDTDGFQGLITTRQNFSSTTFPSESGATGSYYGETVRGMRFVSPLVEQK